MSIELAVSNRNIWKESGKQVVFTNGCFDILHRGHIIYLEQAKLLGDVLVVGLNSDASVQLLKGENRPIKGIENRAAVLAGLEFVDCIVVFEDETPEELIKAMQPDVLVKGGDYKVDQIVGASFVKEHGGKVVVIDFVEGESSSKIINKMEGA